MSATNTPIRVWTNPQVKDAPNLVHLTAGALTLATVPQADLETRARRAALEPAIDGRVIPLAKVTRLEGSQDGADVVVQFRAEDETPCKAEATLGTTDDRNELLEAVEGRLGSGWERVEGTEGRLKVLLGTVAVVAIAAFLTWVAHGVALDAEAGKPLRRGGGKGKLFDLAIRGLTHVIGARGVLIVFCVVTALIALFGIKAVLYPGVRLIVRRIEDR